MSRIRRSPVAAAAFAATALVLLAGSLPAPASAGEEPGVAVAFEGGSPSFAEALAKAKAADKPLFIDFWSDG